MLAVHSLNVYTIQLSNGALESPSLNCYSQLSVIENLEILAKCYSQPCLPYGFPALVLIFKVQGIEPGLLPH